MADAELAAVRTEIKAWEREFRSAQGRDPSVQDIKDHPHIGTCPAIVAFVSPTVSQPTNTSFTRK